MKTDWQQERAAQGASVPVVDVVRAALSTRNPAYAEAKLDTSASLSELGLSSLDIVSAVARVEKHYGIQLDETDLMLLDTLGEFCAHIEREIDRGREQERE